MMCFVWTSEQVAIISHTELTDLLLQSRRSVFAVQYEMIQVNLVIKLLNCYSKEQC
jgi:hypothetical protein